MCKRKHTPSICSEKLRELMDKRKIKAPALAKVLHCHQSSVYQWLRGDLTPSLEMSVDICDYFGISLDEFAGRSTE